MSIEGQDLSKIKEEVLKAAQEQSGEVEVVDGSSLETTEQPNQIGSTVIIPADDNVMLVADTNGVSSTVAVEKGNALPQSHGLIIEQAVENAKPKSEYVGKGISEESAAHIEEYVTEFDAQVEAERKRALEHGFDEEAAAKGIVQKPAVAEEEEEVDQDENFEENYSKGIILIDKTGMGSAINFTDEEREKLQRVKSITLEEIEVVELQSIKYKKAKKNSVDKIIEEQSTALTTPVILSASGYTAVMKGCSTFELISLMSNSQNSEIDTRKKWTLLHSKIQTTSIGAMTYDEFLQNTASIDYDTLIYGVLCSTYPDEDKIALTCPKCNHPFEHKYTTHSLIRAEKISEKLGEILATIVDNAGTEQSAKRAHENSAFNTVKTIKLPISGYIVELHVQSAHDLIETSIKGLATNTDEKYNQAAIMSTAVRQVLVPDPEEAGSYLSYDSALEITKVIYSLLDTDILVLTKQTELILDDLTFEFGLMDVKCPKCGNHQKSLKLDVDQVLFLRYQQAATTKIK